MRNLLVAVIIGVVLGGVVSKFLFIGSFLNLLVWGVVGILIGWLSESKKYAIRDAGVYGFVLSFVFMFIGYQGSAPILSRIPFFAVLGLVGMVCGIVLGFIGSMIPHKVKS